MSRRIIVLVILAAWPWLSGCATSLGFMLGKISEDTKVREVRVAVPSAEEIRTGELVSLQLEEEISRRVFHFSYVDRETSEIVGYQDGATVSFALNRVRTIEVERQVHEKVNEEQKWIGLAFGAFVDGVIVYKLASGWPSDDIELDWNWETY